jgi:hypothetical protein
LTVGWDVLAGLFKRFFGVAPVIATVSVLVMAVDAVALALALMLVLALLRCLTGLLATGWEMKLEWREGDGRRSPSIIIIEGRSSSKMRRNGRGEEDRRGIKERANGEAAGKQRGAGCRQSNRRRREAAEGRSTGWRRRRIEQSKREWMWPGRIN